MTFDRTHIRLETPRPVTPDEKSDIEQAVEAIMSGTSFFFAGTDEISDSVRAFLEDTTILSNLELIEVEGESE